MIFWSLWNAYFRWQAQGIVNQLNENIVLFSPRLHIFGRHNPHVGWWNPTMSIAWSPQQSSNMIYFKQHRLYQAPRIRICSSLVITTNPNECVWFPQNCVASLAIKFLILLAASSPNHTLALLRLVVLQLWVGLQTHFRIISFSDYQP